MRLELRMWRVGTQDLSSGTYPSQATSMAAGSQQAPNGAGGIPILGEVEEVEPRA